MQNINIDQLDPSVKKQNIEHFVHLVRIAITDDIVSYFDLELLHQVGKKMGFTDLEIDNIIETTGHSEDNTPFELTKNFLQVYNLVKTLLAGGIIDKNEMRLVGDFAAAAGFKEREIPHLLVLLIRGIKRGQNEEELFEVFKKERIP